MDDINLLKEGILSLELKIKEKDLLLLNYKKLEKTSISLGKQLGKKLLGSELAGELLEAAMTIFDQNREELILLLETLEANSLIFHAEASQIKEELFQKIRKVEKDSLKLTNQVNQIHSDQESIKNKEQELKNMEMQLNLTLTESINIKKDLERRLLELSTKEERISTKEKDLDALIFSLQNQKDILKNKEEEVELLRSSLATLKKEYLDNSNR